MARTSVYQVLIEPAIINYVAGTSDKKHYRLEVYFNFWTEEEEIMA